MSDLSKLPPALVPAVEKLAQNLYICASSLAQEAALACFEPESIAEYERRRAEFKARRDYFVPALNDLGLTVPVMPDGAFYAWADCTAAATSDASSRAMRSPVPAYPYRCDATENSTCTGSTSNSSRNRA